MQTQKRKTKCVEIVIDDVTKLYVWLYRELTQNCTIWSYQLTLGKTLHINQLELTMYATCCLNIHQHK